MACSVREFYPKHYQSKKFVSMGIELELLDSGQFYAHTVCLNCSEIHHVKCYEFLNAFDFLEKFKADLDGFPRENAIFRLAQHLNYPLCLFVEMLENGRKKRQSAEQQTR